MLRYPGYSFFRVLVDTGFGTMIQARLKVEVKGLVFLLYVKEVGGAESALTKSNKKMGEETSNLEAYCGDRRTVRNHDEAATGGGEAAAIGVEGGEREARVGMGNEASTTRNSNSQRVESGCVVNRSLAHMKEGAEDNDQWIGSPTKTKTWDDDRGTDEVIQEILMGPNEIVAGHCNMRGIMSSVEAERLDESGREVSLHNNLGDFGMEETSGPIEPPGFETNVVGGIDMGMSSSESEAQSERKKNWRERRRKN
ncbi:hypothetical protein PIB30_082163 [Stylosanthes scabra]|uniref:Uncharacterized protein n=1 Tax=Stylosanthes scabra TaxID=79078 RepID=A0ABU6SU35_9FABA|nr:hypothetical protein [Stylosanthes scabra]